MNKSKQASFAIFNSTEKKKINLSNLETNILSNVLSEIYFIL